MFHRIDSVNKFYTHKFINAMYFCRNIHTVRRGGRWGDICKRTEIVSLHSRPFMYIELITIIYVMSQVRVHY